MRKPELGTESPGLQTSTGRKVSSSQEGRALTLLLNSEVVQERDREIEYFMHRQGQTHVDTWLTYQLCQLLVKQELKQRESASSLAIGRGATPPSQGKGGGNKSSLWQTACILVRLILATQWSVEPVFSLDQANWPPQMLLPPGCIRLLFQF